MTHFLRVAVLAAAMAAGTWIGWWMVPVVGAAWGVMTHREHGGPIAAGIAGMLAWGAILAFGAFRGPIGTVAATLSGLLMIRPVGIYALTIAFPGLLAVTGAFVARSAAVLARGADR